MLFIHLWPSSNPKHSRPFHCSIHTAPLSFLIFLAVNLIAFNLFSTMQLELFLKRGRYTILKSLHWLKIDQRIQYKFSLSPTKQCKKPSYLYSLLNLQANTSNHSSTVIIYFNVHQSTLVSKYPIDRSLTMLRLSGIVFLKLFAIVYVTRHTNVSGPTNHLRSLRISVSL